jgi:hypothetical protein
MERPTTFRAVPFDAEWVSHNKLDLRAIYRRPVRDEWTGDQKLDEKTGLPQWDLTGPLPLRRHNDYIRKGFQYVTLADMKSLHDAAPYLREKGLDPRSFIMDPRMGPWNDQFYLTSQVKVDSAQMTELRRLVEKHGSEAIEESRRLVDPHFRLPSNLRGIAPGASTQQSVASTQPSVAAPAHQPVVGETNAPPTGDVVGAAAPETVATVTSATAPAEPSTRRRSA